MKKFVSVSIAVLVLCASTTLFAAGYVRLYQDKGFIGHSVTVRFKQNISDFHSIGMNDTVSSVKYNVPRGWEAILYRNSGFTRSPYVLQGSGSIPDLGTLEDEASSLEWRRR